MQGCGPGYRRIFFVSVYQTRIPEDLTCIGMPLEIIKGLYRKEDAIYRQKQGIEKYLMETTFHCGAQK